MQEKRFLCEYLLSLHPKRKIAYVDIQHNLSRRRRPGKVFPDLVAGILPARNRKKRYFTRSPYRTYIEPSGGRKHLLFGAV